MNTPLMMTIATKLANLKADNNLLRKEMYSSFDNVKYDVNQLYSNDKGLAIAVTLLSVGSFAAITVLECMVKDQRKEIDELKFKVEQKGC